MSEAETEVIHEFGYGMAERLEWSTYAQRYDAVCAMNPSYQENVELFKKFLMNAELTDSPAICEIGAGTGNFIRAANETRDFENMTHVDMDSEMNRLARAKYAKHNINNVRIVEDYAQRCDFEPGEFDVIYLVNSLYALSPQVPLLSKIKTWLKPTGSLFVIDFGRKMNFVDWNLYIFRHSLFQNGFRHTFKFFAKNWEFAKQNRNASHDQDAGRFWLHTPPEFRETLEISGFNVIEQNRCYRDYCDLAICRIE